MGRFSGSRQTLALNKYFDGLNHQSWNTNGNKQGSFPVNNGVYTNLSRTNNNPIKNSGTGSTAQWSINCLAMSSKYIAFSYTGVLTGVGSSTTTGIYLYNINNQTYTNLGNPGATTIGTAISIAISPSSRYIIFGNATDVASPLNRGGAYIYDTTTASWTNLSTTAGQPITALAANSYFGLNLSVAISDNYAVIGAYGVSTNRGNAYLYNLNTGAWTDLSTTAGQPITVLPSGTLFGQTVAIYNDTVVISAKNRAVGASAAVGTVYTYNTTTGTWLDLSTTAGNAIALYPTAKAIGTAVAINDKFIAMLTTKFSILLYNYITGAWIDTSNVWMPIGFAGTTISFQNDSLYIGYNAGKLFYLFDTNKLILTGPFPATVASSNLSLLTSQINSNYLNYPLSFFSGNFNGYIAAAANTSVVAFNTGTLNLPTGVPQTSDIVLINTENLKQQSSVLRSTKCVFLTTTGYGTWTVPSDYNSAVAIVAVGAGGMGGTTSGGGGGALTMKVNSISLTPGQTTYYYIGNSAMSATYTFGNSWFNPTANTSTGALVLGTGGGAGVGTSGGSSQGFLSQLGDFRYGGGTGGNGLNANTGAGGGSIGASTVGSGGSTGGSTTSGVSWGGGGGGQGGNGGGAGNTTAGGNGGTGYGVASQGAQFTTSTAANPGMPGWGAGGGGGFDAAGLRNGANGSGFAFGQYTLFGTGAASIGGGGGGGAAGTGGIGGNGGFPGGAGGGGSGAAGTGGSGANGAIIIAYYTN